ncbi:putative immunoglobulin-blocking virulence protein [Mycoplasma bradburyae]|uniref:putative immunoglobulin-blocking virulence protein n=1 Tax=Mycoplasma bradburyae TaxID=2963128 RepID=UPI00233FA1DC|nr:putative immunoglobulin-blocking virulence protein [Mycoplasma bradburyae]MDC4182510.1 putative immunoglobulin-blocking virulence protein [Mycoplasma bradburyae]
MLNSKKRKIIKLIALSATSLVIGAGSTLGVVYSSSKSDTQSNLIKRSNEVKLDNNSTSTSDSYNSNRDFNLVDKPKKPEIKDIVETPKNPEPQPEPNKQPSESEDESSELAPDTAINYVTYEKEAYNLDKNTPAQPNDPSKQVLSDEQAKALFTETKKKLDAAKNIITKVAANGNDPKARDEFYKIIGYHNKELYDSWWDKLFNPPTSPGRARGIDDLLISINTTSDSFIMSEAKANRQWEVQPGYGNTTITFGYKNEDDNPVINYYKKVSSYRVLGNPNKWALDNSDQILSGEFDGWTKTDATSEYTNGKYGINNDDGIEVRHYTPTNKSDPYYKDKKDLNVFVLDVDNTSGYEKFINFIKKVYDDDHNKQIGVVLKNVGKKNTTRNVYDIIEALPPNVATLTVFLEGANTTSLLALENRNLRELNIYTTGTVNTDLWGINPLALKHINFLPSLIAYNVGGFNPYPKGTTIASTPIFTTLKFDRNDDYKRVQEGLDIAKARRSERIFQGNFQGDGAKPVFWDFADAPIIRNLKNLNVHDAELRYVRLSADLIQSDKNGNTYVTYDLDEFNHSQWTAAMQYRPSYAKRYISFGRGTEIQQPKNLILRGSQNTLEREGLQDLLSFIKYTTNSGAFKNVYVSSGYLANQIKAAAASENNDINVYVKPLDYLNKQEKKVFNIDPTLNAIGEKKDSSTLSKN